MATWICPECEYTIDFDDYGFFLKDANEKYENAKKVHWRIHRIKERGLPVVE